MWFYSDKFYNTYSVRFVSYDGIKSEVLQWWQVTRDRWTSRDTRMVWDTLHDYIQSYNCTNVVAYVQYGKLDDVDFGFDSIMKFQSVVHDFNYPELRVHDITRNLRYPVEHVNRRTTRVWYLAR